jgi:hypothetical protein
MNKKLILILIFLFFVSTTAYAWEKATHAYIVDHMKKMGGPHKLAKIYGAMAPDIFNYAFDLPSSLYDYLHFQTHNNFMEMWNAIEEKHDKSFAFGFVSHNDVWGADYTAHWEAITTGIPEGYIITKATALHQFLWDNVSAYRDLALLDVDYDTYIELCHNVVEAAGDIIIKREYPQIGSKIMDSGYFKDETFKNLLMRAYYTDLAGLVGQDAAQQIILGYEDWFRQYMVIGYGQLLQQDESVVINQIVEDFNSLVGAYLLSKDIILPPGTDLRPLIYFALTTGISLCEPDYMTEVNATIDFVMERLEFHNIN